MAEKTTNTTPIPGPPGLPLVGNAFAIDFELPLRTFQSFAEEYGKLAYSHTLASFGTCSMIAVENLENVTDMSSKFQGKYIV